MNYIKHTIAAHEHLRRQPDARPQHIALYWALFFAWNAEFFDKSGLILNHEQLMAAAHIGNRHTYRDALRDLDTWGLIAYKPSKARGTVSTCSLKVLDGFVRPEVAPQTSSSKATSGPTEDDFVGPEVAQVLRPEMASQTDFVGPEVAQDSLLGQTSFQTSTTNVGGGTEKKIGEGFSGDGLSAVQEVMATDNLQTLGAAPKQKVAPKKKGVHEAASREAAGPNEPRRRGGRSRRPEVPFAESDLATYEAFAAAFAGTDYELADLRFYYEKVSNWRKNGEPPIRADWKATAKNFMLNDVHDNRLKLAPTTQRHDGSPGTGPGNPGGSATGYRSSRWDT